MLKDYLIVEKSALPDYFLKVVEARRLLESGAAQEELDAIRQDAEAEMDEAVKFADASPYPDPATVLDDMYVTDNERCVAR